MGRGRSSSKITTACVLINEWVICMEPRVVSPPADASTHVLVDDAPDEKADGNGLIEIAEGNVVSACSVFVASVVLDALNALPSTIIVDVPTSLRTTALVLIALLAERQPAELCSAGLRPEHRLQGVVH